MEHHAPFVELKRNRGQGACEKQLGAGTSK